MKLQYLRILVYNAQLYFLDHGPWGFTQNMPGQFFNLTLDPVFSSQTNLMVILSTPKEWKIRSQTLDL